MAKKLPYSLAEQRLYPYFKLTRERFPRLLATRKIAADQAEYFGAFLPETGVRFWLDALNKVFRLRACAIDVDGSFSVPCPQFYRKRCLAPCVANLCDDSTYEQQVQLVRWFFRRDRVALEQFFRQSITALSENLAFEAAQEQHDLWLTIEKLLTAKEWNFWLADAVDTFVVEETATLFLIHWVTMRGRKTLGKRIFAWEKAGPIHDILPAVLPQAYQLHAPKEIRVSHDFPTRAALADELSLRFQRKIKITVRNESQPRVYTERALERAKFERALRQIRRADTWPEIQTELQTSFSLPRPPRRIEAFDVAHLSGHDQVAGRAVWQDGQLIPQAAKYWFFDTDAEIETLRQVIAARFANAAEPLPDIVLVDGGKAHLNAAAQVVNDFSARPVCFVAAVKPPQAHGAIARFLTEAGTEILFDAENAAHHILQIVRDEAHSIANLLHRQRREYAHYYELAQILPSLTERQRLDLLKQVGSIKQILALTPAETQTLSAEVAANVKKDLLNYHRGASPKVEPFIVPLRFVAADGAAEDLRPLTTYHI
ncbi:MAG TPA: hypothetical protein VFZ34_09960 [Blastocatellia bacterium]|nr:hypothetical protein [Blastocatellia bacterium]